MFDADLILFRRQTTAAAAPNRPMQREFYFYAQAMNRPVHRGGVGSENWGTLVVLARTTTRNTNFITRLLSFSFFPPPPPPLPLLHLPPTHSNLFSVPAIFNLIRNLSLASCDETRPDEETKERVRR